MERGGDAGMGWDEDEDAGGCRGHWDGKGTGWGCWDGMGTRILGWEEDAGMQGMMGWDEDEDDGMQEVMG